MYGPLCRFAISHDSRRELMRVSKHCQQYHFVLSHGYGSSANGIKTGFASVSKIPSRNTDGSPNSFPIFCTSSGFIVR